MVRMSLGAKQELFAELECQIVPKAISLGFKVRGGEYLRFQQQCDYNATHCGQCKQTRAHRNHKAAIYSAVAVRRHKFRAIGSRNSLHKDKLAKDVILFKNGKPRWDTESYRELGEWWEGLHELTAWGGRFNDGGHFSVTHGGRK